jgi:hypothetical protein
VFCQSRKSQAATPKSEQRLEPLRAESRVSPLDAAPSLGERVEAERARLFKALSIVECCRFATATLFEVNDSEYMVPAFEAICDLLSTSAEELELIASDCEKVA